MKFEKGQLQQILSCSAATEAKWLDPINKTCEKFGINTKLRLAAFIAQVGHESGRLSTMTENLNYSASGLMNTWPARFDSFKANSAARNPEKIANIVYASRMGNGNEASGEGWKYRGRGLIQCTGKSNYDAFSQACGVNAVSNPDMLTTPEYAAMSAGWFWNSKGLNNYADRGDLLTTTKRINGGTHGQADRELLYKRALAVLGGEKLLSDAELAKKPVEVSPDSSASVTDQKTPAAKNSAIVEPRSAAGSGGTSQYPWNLVFESRSGHLSEYDDTPGAERVSIAHRTGSYWEMNPLGTITHKSILDSYKITKEDAYDYTGGNYTQQVKGQSYRQSTGDMIFKTEAQIFMNANKVQVNTGTFSVSGEVVAPNINANIFGGMSGLAFGDMLAKEALLAYDIKKGKAPMLGGSMGFKGTPGSGSGSADGQMSNNLSNAKPDGTPIITNGVKTAVGVVAAAAAVSAIADILKGGDHDEKVSNALKSASDEAAAQADNQTPVFMKHVTFDKPTLLSQSTVTDIPDPSLYVNNVHTIVDSEGVGTLHISDGDKWVKVGKGAGVAPDDPVIVDIIDTIGDNQETNTAAIVREAQERANALLNEAVTRSNEILAEARARQLAISEGLLAEAAARQASIQAESITRQTSDESLSNYMMTQTASLAQNITAAISTERQARTDAISAESLARDVLAAKLDDNIASVTTETIARANGDSAIASTLTNYIASNDTALATARSEIITQVQDANTAMASQINTLATKNLTSQSMIESEIISRVAADSALSNRIDTVLAKTGDNSALISEEVLTRTSADSALASRIDVLVTKTNDNSALISNEQKVRSDAISSIASTIEVLSASTTAATKDIAKVSADIVTVNKAVVDGDKANADSITALSSTVGGHTATINTQTSSINGIRATWGVRVNNNGQVAGIGLVSNLVNGTANSSFDIVANTLRLVDPNDNNRIVAPFSVTSNGDAYFNGTGYFKGDISAASGSFRGGVYGGSYGSGYSWPGTWAGGGFHLSGSGLLLGNANTWYAGGGGGYFEVNASGNMSNPCFYTSGNYMSIGGGKITFNGANGSVVADNVDIRRRIVLQTGTHDTEELVSGTVYEYDYNYPLPVGTVAFVDIKTIINTDIIDWDTYSMSNNQPYGVTAMMQDGALRNWVGGNGTTIEFSVEAEPSVIKTFSSNNSYSSSARLAISFRVRWKLTSGSFQQFRIPPITWAIYKL